MPLASGMGGLGKRQHSGSQRSFTCKNSSEQAFHMPKGAQALAFSYLLEALEQDIFVSPLFFVSL